MSTDFRREAFINADYVHSNLTGATSTTNHDFYGEAMSLTDEPWPTIVMEDGSTIDWVPSDQGGYEIHVFNAANYEVVVMHPAEAKHAANTVIEAIEQANIDWQARV